MSYDITAEPELEVDDEEPEEEKYPSAMDAIFNDDTRVNFRCACKFALWHGIYAVLTIIGVAFIAVSYPIYGAYNRLTGTKQKLQASEHVRSVIESERVQTGAKYVAGGALVVLSLAAVALLSVLLYTIVSQNWNAIIEFLIEAARVAVVTIGVIIGAGVSIIVGYYTLEVYQRTRLQSRVKPYTDSIRSRGDNAIDRSLDAAFGAGFKVVEGTKSAAETAKEQGGAVGMAAQRTPGVRRVYGECPVSLSADPIWFDKVNNFIDRVDDDE